MVAIGGNIKGKFPEADKLEATDIPRSEFPVIVSEFVRCSYATGNNRRKLMDPGSCMIPKGFTIRLEDWRKQNA